MKQSSTNLRWDRIWHPSMPTHRHFCVFLAGVQEAAVRSLDEAQRNPGVISTYPLDVMMMMSNVAISSLQPRIPQAPSRLLATCDLVNHY